MKVRQTNNTDVFECQSESNPDKWYTVIITLGSCTCPHYTNRLKNTGGFCKHYTEVMNYLKQHSTPIPKIEFNTGDDAQTFVTKYGENTLTQLKRNFEVVEQKGRLIKL